MSDKFLVASLVVCSMLLGIVLDETARWFYRNYAVTEECEELFEEEEEE